MSISKGMFLAQHCSRSVNIGGVMPIICFERILSAWSWTARVWDFCHWLKLEQVSFVTDSACKTNPVEMLVLGYCDEILGNGDLKIWEVLLLKSWAETSSVFKSTLIYVWTSHSLEVSDCFSLIKIFFHKCLGSKSITVKGEKKI